MFPCREHHSTNKNWLFFVLFTHALHHTRTGYFSWCTIMREVSLHSNVSFLRHFIFARQEFLQICLYLFLGTYEREPVLEMRTTKHVSVGDRGEIFWGGF
jgi:hypothetical protein